jgi:DNA-binding CsgD family transcriptional regulator
MQKTDALSALISDIYDAALDSGLWESALGKARDFVGGCSASLFTKDASLRDAQLLFDDGTSEPYYKRLYFEKYVKLDPLNTGHFFGEIGKPVSTKDLINYEDFLETRIYKEWAEPQGLVDFAAVTLDKSPSTAALFGIFRHKRQGLVDNELKGRLRLLAPHLRRAILVGKVIDVKAAVSKSMISLLDRLTAGVFLVNGEGITVHANASGEKMIASGEVLRISGGRLQARDSQAQLDLSQAFSAAAHGDGAISSMGIALPLTGGGEQPYVAHVLPLTSEIRARALYHAAASAAIFVHKAAFQAPAAPQLVAKHYLLTPTELRVLLCIVDSGSVPQAAQALGLAESTIKTHLHRIFLKTGTTRQSDLVKVLAAFANPFDRNADGTGKDGILRQREVPPPTSC